MDNYPYEKEPYKNILLELAYLTWVVAIAAILFSFVGSIPSEYYIPVVLGLMSSWILGATIITLAIWSKKFGTRISAAELERIKGIERQTSSIAIASQKGLQTLALSHISRFIKEHQKSILWKEKLSDNERITFIRALLDSIWGIFWSDAISKGKELPAVWVKATFFVYKKKQKGEFSLELYSYAYPAAMSPQVTHFDSVQHRNSTAIHAMIEDRPYSYDNLEKRCSEGEPWIQMYPGQTKMYKSLLCLPIFSGDKGAPNREPIGVVTIDTNVLNYFAYYKENPEMVHFYNVLLSPLKQLIVDAFKNT